ncbi:glycosyltransferase [Alsobacter sp. R-9]
MPQTPPLSRHARSLGRPQTSTGGSPASMLARAATTLVDGPGPAAASKPLLICFSHLRWNFVFQRPQHLLTRAARHYRVVVFEEPVFGAVESPSLDVSSSPEGVTVVVPQLPDGMSERAGALAQRHLLDAFVAREGAPQILWYYTPLAMQFSTHLAAPVRLYDCMDELSGFRNAPASLPLMERRLMARADLVFTGGMSLYEAKRGRHPSVHAFPSSVEQGHFRRARAPDRTDPQDQAGLPRPRLGFFGVVDERMDLGLVEAAASLRPDWQFVMLGPVVKIDEASLPRRPNLHWLGGKAYRDLPDYLGGWNAGIMPFALNEATRFISPTKTPEFLAAGLPVVSTPVADVVRPYGDRGLVAIAADPGAFVARAAELMAGPPAGWREAVERHLSTMSWDRTFDAMHALIRRVAADKARTDRPAVAVPPRVASEGAHV